MRTCSRARTRAKAVTIGSERVLRDSARVFGTVFDVEGDVASPLVFYLTDSTDNFLYGALVLRCAPQRGFLGAGDRTHPRGHAAHGRYAGAGSDPATGACRHVQQHREQGKSAQLMQHTQGDVHVREQA